MKVQRFINSVFTSNTYVLTEEHSSYCWLVDIGDITPVLEYVGNRKICGLFITHTHYDHIYGINKLVKHFPDCVVYTSERGKEGLYSDRLNFSRYHADSLLFKGNHLQLLKEGDSVSLFKDIELKVLATPGHDWSCLSFYTNDSIFTGDSYIPGIKVITSFPHSDKEQAAASLHKILSLSKTRDIYPGHNDSILLDKERDCMLANE